MSCRQQESLVLCLLGIAVTKQDPGGSCAPTLREGHVPTPMLTTVSQTSGSDSLITEMSLACGIVFGESTVNSSDNKVSHLW